MRLTPGVTLYFMATPLIGIAAVLDYQNEEVTTGVFVSAAAAAACLVSAVLVNDRDRKRQREESS